MPVSERDYEAGRGKRDAARHQHKQREAIKQNIPNIIADTSIITRQKGEVVRIPLRGIKSYRFKYGGKDGGGVGQGEGKVGDIIARRRGEGDQPGKAGDEPGVDYIESEIEMEELIKMMLEDLGLPNLEEREIAEIETPKGWTLSGIEKTGQRANIDKKRTMREGVKRFLHFVEELKKETGKSDDECEAALHQAGGDLMAALKLLQGEAPIVEEKVVVKTTPAIIESDDLRFRIPENETESYSNAVVLAMMDTSGSMDIMKKYLARSFFFWQVEFLRRLYRNVEIRFIAHHTEAKLVDEDTFFHKGESGGTHCHSAYELAAKLVETDYPPEKWNVYGFHFSDGEDWQPDRTVEAVKRLMETGVNMVGYGELQVGSYTSSNLMPAFVSGLELEEAEVDELKVYTGKNRRTPFLGVAITGKDDLYPALKEFLRKERW